MSKKPVDKPLPEVIGEINRAVEDVMASRIEEVKDQVKIDALQSVKTHINALPDYASAYVWAALAKSSQESFSNGHNAGTNRHYGNYEEPQSAVDMSVVFDSKVIL